MALLCWPPLIHAGHLLFILSDILSPCFFQCPLMIRVEGQCYYLFGVNDFPQNHPDSLQTSLSRMVFPELREGKEFFFWPSGCVSTQTQTLCYAIHLLPKEVFTSKFTFIKRWLVGPPAFQATRFFGSFLLCYSLASALGATKRRRKWELLIKGYKVSVKHDE